MDSIVRYIDSLFDKENKCFRGDEFADCDMRFLYSALSSLKILNKDLN